MIIYEFFWNILAFNLCFPEKPFLLHYNLQHVDKVHLCKQRWNIYLFLSTWSFQNLAFPAGSPVNLMAYCNQITTSYTNHCFNMLSLVVFKLFMPCTPLCCTRTSLMLLVILLISYLFCKIVVSYITQCVTRPLTKSMMDKHLKTIDHIFNST